MQVLAELIGGLVLPGLVGLGVEWLARNVRFVKREKHDMCNPYIDKMPSPPVTPKEVSGDELPK